jgi:hypothetical protein
MKCLLYCTIALPWLYQGADGKWYVTKSKCAQVGCKPARNGYVSFECDCKEAFKYDFVHRSGDSSNFYIRDQRTERMKDCLSNDDLFDYGKGKTLYAYHFENVKPIDPMPITQLYQRRGYARNPLTRAPQVTASRIGKSKTTKAGLSSNVGRRKHLLNSSYGKFF